MASILPNTSRSRALRLPLLTLAVAGAFHAMPADAAIYIVNNTADSGTGSLRQAVVDANIAGGSNTIRFAIPGTGVHTITLLSQLPAISSSLVIDGYSQAGALVNTNRTDEGGLNAVLQVELVGTGGFYGFYLSGANGIILTVQGLSMHGFISAIVGYGAAGTSELRAFGNYLCTSVDGSAVAPGPVTGSGITTSSTPSFIGGELPAQRNLISGCRSQGVLIGGAAALKGNLIGTDASGTLAIPNATFSNRGGIDVPANRANVRIGGSGLGASNVISGNHTSGIFVSDAGGTGLQYTGLEIKGNHIGTDWSGTQRVPNGNLPHSPYGGGIRFVTSGTDPTPAIIGGFGPGEANLIAYNYGAGIIASSAAPSDSFDSRGNAVFGNLGVGRANIDTGTYGPSPNDAGDADTGANYQQNWPEIISASQNGNSLTVTYRVDTAAANASYPLRIDFYASAHGGSGLLLAQDSYPAASAQLPRTVVLNVPDGATAIPLVALATDATFHSSELSPAFDVIFEYGFD